MTISRKKAVFLSVLLAVPSLAYAADESAFPIGTWGQTPKHCALFQEGAGADAIQITATERRYRESEGQLVKEPISITPQANGRFRITWKPYPDSSSWEDVWTTDGGRTLLAQGENEPPSIPVRKYVACTDKAAPAPDAFGKWKIDPNPDTPHATLDSGPEFPRIEVSCVGQDALGYRFTMADGSFPKSINIQGAEEDINLAVGPSGFMPKNDASLFVREITDLINQAKSDGSTAPESAFVTQFGVNGKVPAVVPIGGLMAVREWLRPLCARAKIAPPPSASPVQGAGTEPLHAPLPGSGQVTLSCDVTSRGSSAVGRILVSIDMNRGAYAIINPASHAVSGVFGMISVDSSYRLQTASPMGRLLINRSTGQLTNYNVSELMGADNRGFCVPVPSYVPFN